MIFEKQTKLAARGRPRLCDVTAACDVTGEGQGRTVICVTNLSQLGPMERGAGCSLLCRPVLWVSCAARKVWKTLTGNVGTFFWKKKRKHIKIYYVSVWYWWRKSRVMCVSVFFNVSEVRVQDMCGVCGGSAGVLCWWTRQWFTPHTWTLTHVNSHTSELLQPKLLHTWTHTPDLSHTWPLTHLNSYNLNSYTPELLHNWTSTHLNFRILELTHLNFHTRELSHTCKRKTYSVNKHSNLPPFTCHLCGNRGVISIAIIFMEYMPLLSCCLQADKKTYWTFIPKRVKRK